MITYCFTLFLVFFYGLDVGLTVLSSNSRHPVVVTAPSEWPLKFQSNRKSNFRETRAASPITTKEFDFKNDRHTRGLIHWSGNYSKALFFVTQDMDTHGVKESTVWRSTNYGQTFDKDDSKFERDAVITTFYVCPNNKLKLIFTDLKKPAVYVTTDEGTTFTQTSASFHATNIVFHPEKEDWIIAQDGATNKAYVSTDLGSSWRQLAVGRPQSTIYRVFWGVAGIDVLGTLFFELSFDGATAVLYQDNALVTSFQVFTGTVHGFTVNSLEVVDEYMFVHVPATQYKDMYRSYKRGPFQKAYFATIHPFQDFFVVDATEHQMFVAVYHYDNLTSVYTSDSTGRFFTLSLDNVVSAPSVNWLNNNNPYVDFYRVPGLQGIYVANKRDSQNHVRTVISFNKGGDWQALLLESSTKTCKTADCRVHLHMSRGSSQFGLQDMFLSPNGVGLIMAHGDVGDYLDYGQSQMSSTYRPTLMISRSAGVTWYKALTAPSNRGFDFLFGDHGSYMAATDHYQQSNDIHYSCHDGNESSWKVEAFSSSQLIVNGMFTEPGETTEIAMVFCSKASSGSFYYNWAIVQVNFSQLFTQKCSQKDYVPWAPFEEVDIGRCLLGQRSSYERRQHDSCCYNGREYIRSTTHFKCSCTREDYECDYGYNASTLDASRCVRDKRLPVYHPTSDCTAGEPLNITNGYRKVSGDQCQGGNISQWLPNQTKCPAKALRLMLDSNIEGSAAAVGQQIIFTLTQESGSTTNSLYNWSFGDNNYFTSPGSTFPVTVNHSYSTAGNYNLSVLPSGGNATSAVYLLVPVYDPIINVTITPPHAVTLNSMVTFHCQPIDKFNTTTTTTVPQLGPVHYEWLFQDTGALTLTRNKTLTHVFPTTGRFRVSLSSFNPVSTKATHVYINVYRAVQTLRLGFTRDASLAKQDSKDFDVMFSTELVQTVAEVTGYDTSRFEAFVLPSTVNDPVKTDLSVVAHDSKEEQEINEIIEKVKSNVDSGTITVFLQTGKYEIIATSYEEVQVNHEASASINSNGNGLSGASIGIIIIAILASIIIITAILIGFWYHRRYSRLEHAYSRLNRDSGIQLTLDSDDSDDDSPLAKSGTGQMMAEPDDDDEKLLDDV